MTSRLPRWPRLSSASVPIGLSILGLIGVIGLCLWGANAIGLRWDPFGLDRRRLETVQTRALRAERDAAARRAEVVGERDQARRLEQVLKPVRAAEALTATAAQYARTAHDALTLLEPDRADRLRAHDGELCRLASDLAGCASAPDPARDGNPALRPRDPAAAADPG